jgi:hypothetical protein
MNYLHSTIVLFVVTTFAAAEYPAIKGRVLDKHGSGIPDAQVKLLPAGITVTTSEDGRFYFSETSRQNPLSSGRPMTRQLPPILSGKHLVLNLESFSLVEYSVFTIHGQQIDAVKRWSSSEEFPNICRMFAINNVNQDGQVFWKGFQPPDWGLSVRLIKDD